MKELTVGMKMKVLHDFLYPCEGFPFAPSPQKKHVKHVKIAVLIVVYFTTVHSVFSKWL